MRVWDHRKVFPLRGLLGERTRCPVMGCSGTVSAVCAERSSASLAWLLSLEQGLLALAVVPSAASDRLLSLYIFFVTRYDGLPSVRSVPAYKVVGGILRRCSTAEVPVAFCSSRHTTAVFPYPKTRFSAISSQRWGPCNRPSSDLGVVV